MNMKLSRMWPDKFRYVRIVYRSSSAVRRLIACALNNSSVFVRLLFVEAEKF